MTREEIIIRMMPFSKELKEWCKQHPEFAEALKINYPPRFITLQAVAISYSPLVPEDEVIGVYNYDSKQGKFKQDFIVNKEKKIQSLSYIQDFLAESIVSTLKILMNSLRFTLRGSIILTHTM